ncbi:glycosyltransferase family 2 protein [Sutcliffiella horikoshii]|uniref:glycosyltransferase family 2 protein n=1 Tax=Sutcliffiella horikoshii TaxID=79883 RepID=UPI00384B6426
MKLLTVFTPTFNRGYCLGRCYESLANQTSKNFTWLIIDDGSTDGTKELVETWRRENKIEIEYIWQENQGMHGAHNTAYEHITTELNVCIDSDDYMPMDAVEKISSFWKKQGSEKVSGIVGLDLFTNGQIIGTPLPEEHKTSTLFNLYYKHGVKGDKKLVYRTELTKRYPYPIFTGEKYVGLAYKYYKLDQDYELLIMNEALCVVEYLSDGSSVNMLKQYRKNPKGFAFYRKELMNLPFVSFVFKVRQAVHYVSSSLIMNNRGFISEAPNKGITTLVLPFGYLLYLYIITKTKVA